MSKHKNNCTSEHPQSKKIKFTDNQNVVHFNEFPPPTLNWQKLPREIQGTILSYLPVIPSLIQFMRISKEFKQLTEDLLGGKMEKLNFHLDFSIINPDDISFQDLARVLTVCRVSKEITLHNMRLSFSVLEAVGLTRVETLNLYDCEFFSSMSVPKKHIWHPIPNFLEDLQEKMNHGISEKRLGQTIGDKVLLIRLDSLRNIPKINKTLFRFKESISEKPQRYFQNLKHIFISEPDIRGFLFKTDPDCALEQEGSGNVLEFNFHHSTTEIQSIFITFKD